MITKSGTSSDYINHFRCLQEDLDSNRHLPNNAGIMESTGIKLENGDECYAFNSKKTLIYDKEHMIWIAQN